MLQRITRSCEAVVAVCRAPEHRDNRLDQRECGPTSRRHTGSGQATGGVLGPSTKGRNADYTFQKYAGMAKRREKAPYWRPPDSRAMCSTSRSLITLTVM